MKEQFERHAPNNTVYGMGLIGAMIYFISHATGFWAGVISFLKVIIWLAYLVYEALKPVGA